MGIFVKDIEKQRRINQTLPVTERKRFLDEIVRGFIDFLKEYGYANNSIRSALIALQNFLSYYEIKLSYRFIELPSSRTLKNTDKQKWTINQIREFVDSAEYLRDKAVIMCLFQSGLSISDFLKLNYGDIRRELESDKLPIMMQLYRKKTDIEFKTFFGADSINYLKEYLKTRIDFKDNSPLFTQIGSKKRATTGAIQNQFRSYAEKMEWIEDKDLEGWNPARLHSLRAAFRTRCARALFASANCIVFL